MKLTRYMNFTAIVAIVLGLTACKKYGIEVPDGYVDASQNQANVSIDTNMKNVDRSGYDKARLFPGLVDQSEPRIQNKEFTLDLNFVNQTASNLRISAAPKPQFSTGFYAAPGELIKIVVPAGVDGLSMQIGGHTDNLSGKVPLLRDPIIYAVKALYPGVNYMRNIYGGNIYINASFAIPQPVKFIISGAVASPDFVLGVDTDAGWIAKVKASKTPWLELRAKRVVFLMPTDRVLAKIAAGGLTNPTALMTEWNNKFELDYNAWMGLSDNAADIIDQSPQGPWRGVLDVQLTLGYGHSGIPFVGLNDQYWFNSFTSLPDLFSSAGMWGTYHEFGHNCQQGNVWSWSTLGETTNNLFSFKVANRINADYKILHPAVTSNFPTAIAWASSSAAKNFDSSSDAVINDPFARMTPFVQIFELYGYGAMTKLYTEARRAQRFSINDIDKHDFTYEKLSAYCQVDLMPFFEAWGITVSPLSQSKIAALYPTLTKQIWTYNPLTKTGGTAAITTTVVSASSPAQEGSLANMVDGNLTTFYHSQYSSPTPAQTYPFTIILNAGANTPIKGMYFNGRAGNRAGDAKSIEIFSSKDNVTYTSIGTTTLPNSATRYEYFFPNGNVTAKYFKVVVTNGYTTNPYIVFAELNLIRPN
ncbi:MAG: hypothetical protein EOO91_07285 [Pedobacter sp.]|nr:MAG: hypothetical protein EOO91_07285 [Pedobacter sp.]